jgi:hypothetical protein
MIKANDLRIGNYIINPFGAIITIDEIHKSGVKFKTTIYDLTHCKPIPLTEEILLKCENYNKKYGFSLNETTYLFFNESRGYFYPYLTQDAEFSNLENKCVYLERIKYLHELQNLYFALTNQELNIEL